MDITSLLAVLSYLLASLLSSFLSPPHAHAPAETLAEAVACLGECSSTLATPQHAHASSRHKYVPKDITWPREAGSHS